MQTSTQWFAVSGAGKPSVVRLRVQGLDGLGVAAVVQEVLAAFGEKLDDGALVTVKADKITCRRLPVGA